VPFGYSFEEAKWKYFRLFETTAKLDPCKNFWDFALLLKNELVCAVNKLLSLDWWCT